MPKKFSGENSKAVQAKNRKAAVRNEENEKKAKAAEDALWVDNDKLVLRKQEKKELELKKQQEKLEKKLEVERLLEEENKKLKSAKPARTEKITRHQIETNKEKLNAAEKAKKANDDTVQEIQENVNRLQIDGAVARDVDEAIKILNDGVELETDSHPEKRRKAAYLEFYDNNIDRLKAENPSMRLSQLKQIIFKEFQKSPSNPVNK